MAETKEEKSLGFTICLQDEAGSLTNFEALDLIDYEGRTYIVLLPLNDLKTVDVTILEANRKRPQSAGDYKYVDDMETLNAVYLIFKERFIDEFTFVD